MRSSRSRGDTQTGGLSPRVRASRPEGARLGGSNRTLVTRTDSGSTSGVRGGCGGRGRLAPRDPRARAALMSGSAARAAASPRAITSCARLNPNVENSRTSGMMTTSHLRRCSASESHTRNETDCTSTSTNDTIESRGSSGSVTSLQISTSAPSARASWAGRLRITPPSMSTVSWSTTGENTLGSAMLARMASGRNP